MVTKGEEFHSSQEVLLSENDFIYIRQAIPDLDDLVGYGRLSDDEKFKVEMQSSPLMHQQEERFKVEMPPSPLTHEQEENSKVTSPPSPTCSLPSTDDWAGPYEFELKVNTMNANKKTWLHSNSLNKIFIDVFKSIPLQFKINCPNEGETFFIRALPVYTIPQHMTYPVIRCPLHLKEDESKGLNCQNHVVRCEDVRALYECDEESKRFSVVTPLGCPQPGSDIVTHMYSFACKSSCCGGMNRRPIMVIFTLEKEKQVVGRKTMNFRVCSCPKRDKEKEEKSALEEKFGEDIRNHPGKRTMDPQKQKEGNMNIMPSKKRKSLFSSNEDSDSAKVYNVTIHGAAHYREILRHLIMLKCAEYDETGSQEALSAKADYEELWKQSFF